MNDKPRAQMVDISDIIEKTVTSIDVNMDESRIVLNCVGYKYTMMHNQDCCEQVYIESINGDASDFINQNVLEASESTGHIDTEWDDELAEWTFYNIVCNKGYLQIRFNGSSNGYYSVGVDVIRESINEGSI